MTFYFFGFLSQSDSDIPQLEDVSRYLKGEQIGDLTNRFIY